MDSVVWDESTCKRVLRVCHAGMGCLKCADKQVHRKGSLTTVSRKVMATSKCVG